MTLTLNCKRVIRCGMVPYLDEGEKYHRPRSEENVEQAAEDMGFGTGLVERQALGNWARLEVVKCDWPCQRVCLLQRFSTGGVAANKQAM